MAMVGVLFPLLRIIIVALWAGHSFGNEVPVFDNSAVYVIYGEMPLFLRINVELASRRNPVVVISDVIPPHYDYNSTSLNGNTVEYKVSYVPMGEYSAGQMKFVPLYKHLANDHDSRRMKHESQCFQRWFVLNDFMAKHNVSRCIFGDGDSSLFVNASDAWKLRSQCSAVINVDVQRHLYYWAGAGEASLWTKDGIADFCKFTLEMYSKYLHTVEIKHRTSRTNVVDMSLLWLWWVAHHDSPSWESGRPYLTGHTGGVSDVGDDHVRAAHDASFKEVKGYSMAPVDKSLVLCNGLDVVNRTTFDHMLGWYSVGDRFSFDLDGEGLPFAYSVANRLGGKPETFDQSRLNELSKQKLYINNIHYQGDSKHLILYDICRVLVLTGIKTIYDSVVADHCNKEFEKHHGWPCEHHHRYDRGPRLCL